MSKLDEKLEKIIGEDETTLEIHTLSEGEPDIECIHLTKEGLEQIKQAFVDDGWRDLSKPLPTQGVISLKLDAHKYMTGQEWYNRFHHEFYHLKPDDYVATKADIFNTAIKAAKRAAGIES